MLILVFSNFYVFMLSMKLSDKTKFYEKEVTRLHKGNLEVEKKAFYFDSLQYAASKAAEMDFSKRSEPIFLENLKYARR